jgi:hypothetical protein
MSDYIYPNFESSIRMLYADYIQFEMMLIYN